LTALFPRTDVDRLIDQILLEEPLISQSKKPQLKKLIETLIAKQQENQQQRFALFKVLRAHLLPLTNCAFNKSGSKFITGSYDRTCKVWDTNSGQELLSLDEHTNVVYTMAFNNPYG
jgi:dynein assembly factor with WDR repeat domains 1